MLSGLPLVKAEHVWHLYDSPISLLSLEETLEVSTSWTFHPTVGRSLLSSMQGLGFWTKRAWIMGGGESAEGLRSGTFPFVFCWPGHELVIFWSCKNATYQLAA